ncbi:unnamed protein product [Phyllotreta striolata]|uniref:Phosphatidylethanolamine-binding protein n=1 Tax=Phyllotreta striolata TaxID=444603 RepID=A0A9N9TJX6_PHYSR|nr:unnamed protein product [Phyllotreta striolata]
MTSKSVCLLLTFVYVVAFVESVDIGKMEKGEIVPDVIDKIPSEVLKVIYPSGASVELGNELTPTQVKDEPITVNWTADPNTFYTVAMVDPDAPSREDPKLREVLHWLVGNVKGGDVENGEVIAGYRGSGPPQGTGLHRYVFLVYQQNGKIDFKEKKIDSRSREGRLNFSIRKFAVNYSLGQPVAGNYYQAQFDDYVPILQSQTIQ